MTELETQFCMGLWNGDVQLVRSLLEQHPELTSILHDPDLQSTYFERAAVTDSLEIVQFMAEHGADIHASRGGGTDIGIVYDAIRGGALRVTRWLLEQGAELHDVRDDTRRCQPLLYAAGEGNLELVRMLVESGKADVNATWVSGNALSIAMQNTFIELAAYLRSRGAQTPRELGLVPPPPVARRVPDRGGRHSRFRLDPRDRPLPDAGHDSSDRERRRRPSAAGDRRDGGSADRESGGSGRAALRRSGHPTAARLATR